MRSTQCHTPQTLNGRSGCGRLCRRGTCRGQVIEIIVIRLCAFTVLAAVLLAMLLLGADLGTASAAVVLLVSAACQLSSSSGSRRRSLVGATC